MPTPYGRPWPNEPVATSTHGSSTGTGCPSSRLPNFRNVSSSSSVIAPAALYIEYRSGDACPLEKTRWSFRGSSGLSKSYRRYFASSTDMRSAADIDEVGWPDFGTAAARTESTRSCWPSSRQSSEPSIQVT